MKPTRIALFAVVLVATVGTMLYRSAHRFEVNSDPWRSLTIALGSSRPFEPLISGIPYRPFSATRSDDRAQAPSPDLGLAAALIEHSWDGSLESSRRVAVARLLLDNYEGAVALLEHAVANVPSDVRLRADLAGAYLVRFDRMGRHEDAARALNFAEGAVAADPSVPEAWFNLALARERLYLVRDAARAWEVLALASGPWSQEARSRRAALVESTRETRIEQLALRLDDEGIVFAGSSPTYDVDSDLMAELLERHVLDGWAAAVEAANPKRAGILADQARKIATELYRATGDRFHRLLVSALVNYPASLARTYARGWRRHVAAMRAWDDNRLRSAREACADADAIFGSGTSVLNAARVAITTSLDRLAGRRERAVQRLGTFEHYCANLALIDVCGRVHWQLGLFAGESDDVGRSLSEYRTALEFFTQAHDRESGAVVNALMAAEYLELDDLDSAWEHEAKALTALSVARRIRRDPILTTASMLATSVGNEAGALSFRRPVIEDMTQAGADMSLAFLLTDDALNLHRLGRTRDALRRISEAERSAEHIDDEGTALLARALQRSTEATLLGPDQPNRAVELWGEAIDIYRRRGNDFAVPSLELERGRMFVVARDFSQAANAFTNGIAVVERVRPGLKADADRAAFTSARWDLYAALADLRIREQDEVSAADLLDRARAATLRPQRHEGQGTARVVVPHDAAAISFAVLPSGVHGWLTIGSRRRHFMLAKSAAELSDMIASYRVAVLARRPDVEIRHLSGKLFTAILGSISRDIVDAKRLIFVLDGPLYDLPVSSLFDSSTSEYLVERSSISVTPAIQALDRSTLRRSATTRALVLGGSDRSSAISDRLPTLAATKDEATSIAALYPGASLALGADATGDYFIAQAPHATLIHFAGHAIVNERHPELSRLLLSPSSLRPSGALFANEIDDIDLSGVRLVVLSACDTARGRVARGVGIVGLARSFFAAGVPSVVATLWPVDDNNAAALLGWFHKSWAQGLESDSALREAQITALRHGFSVADWAGPIVLGQPIAR